jgi:hypothetical protein
MAKMAMIVYNEAIDDEIMEALAQCALKNYTKIMGVFGKGTTSGSHLGNDIWPGRNNIILAACGPDDAKRLFSHIRKLRETLGREGVKAFLLPVEELT